MPRLTSGGRAGEMFRALLVYKDADGNRYGGPSLGPYDNLTALKGVVTRERRFSERRSWGDPLVEVHYYKAKVQWEAFDA